MTREEKNAKQRLMRLANGNLYTKRYEKTKRGFLMRLYRNMESRICGVQKRHLHLYDGKELLDRQDFYTWANENQAFHLLWDAWVKSGYERRLCPSVDRIDSSKGYKIENMQFVTFSVNCARTSRRKTPV